MEHGVAELLSQWRRDIQAPEAASLCTALADAGEREPGTLDEAMVVGIGGELESRFPTDGPVLVGVGRMYMACGALKRAIKPLALAANGTERVAAYTLLGELLLRLGDARRSVLSFERAMTGGESSADIDSWLATARSYVGLQDEQGTGAVAREVERAIAMESTKGIADPPTIELPREDTARTRILPRRPLPNLAEPSTEPVAKPEEHVRVTEWGEDPTEVTRMEDRIVAARDDLVASDDDIPTAVLDVLTLNQSLQASRSARAAELEPAAPPAPTPPPPPVVDTPAPPPLRVEPATAVATGTRKPAPPLPVTSGHVLPVARAEAPQAGPAPPSPPKKPVAIAPVRRRRSSVARYLGVVALLAIGVVAAGVYTGRLPRPGLLDAFARGTQSDETPAAAPPTSEEAPRPSAETEAPAASSAPAAPTEARADESAKAPTAAAPTAEAADAGAAATLPKPPVVIRRPPVAPATPPPAVATPKPPEKEAPAKPQSTAKPAPIWAGDPELSGQ